MSATFVSLTFAFARTGAAVAAAEVDPPDVAAGRLVGAVIEPPANSQAIQPDSPHRSHLSRDRR